MIFDNFDQDPFYFIYKNYHNNNIFYRIHMDYLTYLDYLRIIWKRLNEGYSHYKKNKQLLNSYDEKIKDETIGPSKPYDKNVYLAYIIEYEITKTLALDNESFIFFLEDIS